MPKTPLLYPGCRFAAQLVVCCCFALPTLSIDELNHQPSRPSDVGHWAFQPLKKPGIPELPEQPTNPIDAFIQTKLKELGLERNPITEKGILLRRATFDLTGLPPTPAEIAEFRSDNSPAAWEELIDQLLASPRYGERWGRHWLDVARYADTAGDNADYPIPEIRRYRDYVIDAFNSDMPFDQFVQEQLAGDILAKQQPDDRYADKIVATGFLALSRRFGTMPTEHWHLVIEDSIETTGRAFLGLTLRCARCHDHKYDPVSKEDYYALYGFFASTEYPYAGSEEFKSKMLSRMNFVPLVPPPESEPILARYRDNLQKLIAQIKQRESETAEAKRVGELKDLIEVKKKDLENAPGSQAKTELAALQKEQTDLEKKLQDKFKELRQDLDKLRKPGRPPELPVAYAVHDGKPRDVPVQIRGEPAQPGAVIKRGVPKIFGAEIEIPAGESGRLQLARWLTSSENPLTARVIANRIWQHHFGKGLVATPSNFGLRGDPPSHPELLNYLACELIANGWSIKKLHRLIMLSDAYRASSFESAANLEKDPGNLWYWRFERRRLDAETIRDAMLSVAGNLNLNRPGDHPFGEIHSWGYTQHQPFKAVYPSNHRSVYLMTQRLQRHLYLALFDGPDPNTTTEMRTDSTVPLQALFLMNNEFVQEQSRLLAKRILNHSSKLEDQLQFAYEVLWGRSPAESELSKAATYLSEYQRHAKDIPPGTAAFEAWASYGRIMLTANEFFYLD